MSTSKPRTPSGLSAKAATFWRNSVKLYDFRLDELVTLEQVCREIDLIDRMEDLLAPTASKTMIVKGSMGQKVSHPHLSEIRQHRATLNSLLKALGMLDAVAEGQERSSRARVAANARWSRGAAASQ